MRRGRNIVKAPDKKRSPKSCLHGKEDTASKGCEKTRPVVIIKAGGLHRSSQKWTAGGGGRLVGSEDRRLD